MVLLNDDLAKKCTVNSLNVLSQANIYWHKLQGLQITQHRRVETLIRRVGDVNRDNLHAIH